MRKVFSAVHSESLGSSLLLDRLSYPTLGPAGALPDYGVDKIDIYSYKPAV